MKKNRTLVIGLLLVAALALGIGYASTTRDLYVQGTAKTTPQDIDVVFATGTAIQGATSTRPDADSRIAAIKAASKVGAPGDKVISFDAFGLSYAGESVTAVFYVVNNNSYAVSLTTPTVEGGETNTLDHFSADVGDFLDGETNQAFDGTLEPGKTAYFTVTVTLGDVDTVEEIKETFHVHLHAEGLPATGNP